MSITVRGFVELTHVDAITSVRTDYKFKNAITDYGLQYILQTNVFDIEEMFLSDSLVPIDPTDKDPGIADNYLLMENLAVNYPGVGYNNDERKKYVQTISSNNKSFIIGSTAKYLHYNYRDGENPVTDITVREIALMVAHPNDKWEGHYRAAFAKAKIKDESDNPIEFVLKPGDTIEVSYLVYFDFDINLPNILNGETSNIIPKVCFGGHLERWACLNPGLNETTTLKYEIVKPYNQPNTIAFNIVSGASIDTTESDTNMNSIKHGIFLFEFTRLSAGNYHLLLQVNRPSYLLDDQENLVDRSSVEYFNNSHYRITAPANTNVHLYYRGDYVRSTMKKAGGQLSLTLPVSYTNKNTLGYKKLDDGELFDVYVELNNGGLKKLPMQLKGTDLVPPKLVNVGWVDSRNFRFYTDKIGSYSYLIFNILTEEFTMPTGWEVVPNNQTLLNDVNYGTNYTKWSYIESPWMNLEPSNFINDDPDNPSKGMYNLQIPFDMKPHHRLQLMVRDHVNNQTTTTHVYTDRADYQDENFIWDSVGSKTLIRTGQGRYGATYTDHFPIESLSVNNVLVSVVLEDIVT